MPLLVDGHPLLTLKVKYECALDGAERYLAVDESLFWVFAGDKASGEPLLT